MQYSRHECKLKVAECTKVKAEVKCSAYWSCEFGLRIWANSQPQTTPLPRLCKFAQINTCKLADANLVDQIHRTLIGGTSASSPTFAGIIALLNDVRLSDGKPPLGFLNPWIYSSANIGFNDITIGHNGGCGTYGFIVSVLTLCMPFYLIKGLHQATAGWDPGKWALFRLHCGSC